MFLLSEIQTYQANTHYTRVSVINGICRISPSFSHFATDPEREKLKNIDVSQFPHLVLDAVLVALF